MNMIRLGAGALLAVSAHGQPATPLPEVTVNSARVANQTPVGTFAMPVSALRFEPSVDLQARNLAEGQADITLRGGTFENSGVQVGAATIPDPQTGHYLAELPIAPALLTAPVVHAGADLALGPSNATAGGIGFGWRPIRTAGAASAGVGTFGLQRADFYQGVATERANPGRRFGLDVAVAHSESDGSLPYGEHTFDRANVRLQTTNSTAQTDVFAGYQAKRFGWPNLYTPFESKELDSLQTTLFALNHRVELGPNEFLEASAFHRRNKDDYAFNRFAPLGPVHPFQHTTWVTGGALSGRREGGGGAVSFRAEVLADAIESSSLTFGRFRSRTLVKLAVLPEKTWTSGNGSVSRVKAGATYDRTNREGGAFSPVVELSREFPARPLRRAYLSYAQSTQVPSYTALNSSPTSGLFRGNPGLERQTTRNLELGAAGLFHGWDTRAAVFWRTDHALVDWTFRRAMTGGAADVRVARTANAVDLGVGGFEVVARRSWARCDLVVGYTALTKTADYRGAAVDASFYALNYARHRLTAALTVRLGGGLELRVDNVARVQADNSLRVIGGDENLSTALGITYRRREWRGVELALQVENLWDAHFQDVPAVPAARRQVSAGVSYLW